MKLSHIVLLGTLALPGWAAAQVTPPAQHHIESEKLRQVLRAQEIRLNSDLASQRALLDGQLAHALNGQNLVRVDTHAPLGFDYARGQQWYQEDPADSLFRAAHAYFNRQEYRQAAERYASLRTRFPSSRYFCDAAYYEAFSRQRLGTQNDLRTGYRILEGLGSRCQTGARRQDMPELANRINNGLARMGDAEAAERLRKAASEGQNVCDREERSIKIDALNALVQMDPQTANPVLRSVLATKDVCSAPIRRQAMDLVARRNDAESASLLVGIVRSDSDQQNQLAAVQALGRMNNESAYSALEELIRSSNDERVQSAAASAMARNENARVQAAVRALIERRDVSERIRMSAINSLASRNFSTEYWQAMYNRVESEELRKAILNAVARNNSEETQQFLLTLARNPAESPSVRTYALSRVRNTAPINDLYRIFETADSRSMRLSIVSGLSQRKEPEATDRLIDILKNATDIEVRGAALRVLQQPPRKDDPKVTKAITDLLVNR